MEISFVSARTARRGFTTGRVPENRHGVSFARIDAALPAAERNQLKPESLKTFHGGSQIMAALGSR